MRRFVDEDLTGAEFREVDLTRARFVGVVMDDAEIDGQFRRCVLGLTEPFTAMGLGPPVVMEQVLGDAVEPPRPSLDQVLAVRERQAAEVEAWLADATPDGLAATAPVPDDDRWPPDDRGRTVRRCLGTVLNEEHAHHGFCTRDLDRLARQDPAVS